MELINADIRNWWKSWELRLIVLFSVLLQLILVLQGSRRKSIYNYKLKAIVWSTYLAADSAAILALGILSNRLANIKEVTGKLDPNEQLIAFWAPFLLLHLGGPDTITAYSLEDNELWLRRLSLLFTQTGLACYIYFLALTGSPLSILAAAMIAAGFIKYGERSLSLYFASKDQLRDSMLSPPESGPVYPKIMEKYNLSREEGYEPTVDEVIEVQAPEDLSIDGNVHEETALNLLRASSLFQIFKVLFADLILSLSDLGCSESMFKGMSSESAFKIVEIELSFMFDLLYTKGIVLYTRLGIVRRAITLSIICGVLVFFSVAEQKNYTRIDVYITFTLLGVAMLLEIYSVLMMISSDWTRVWVLKNQNRREAKVIGSLRLCQLPRWSNAVAQFSLLQLSLWTKPWILQGVPKLANFHEKMQKYYYISHKPFQNSMKDWICKHLKDKLEVERNKHHNKGGPDVKTVSSEYEAGYILQQHNHYDMTWSTNNIEFDQSILIWHVATELCYFHDRNRMSGMQGEAMTNYKMSRRISRYMVYLIVMHPVMLPTGIGLLRYADTLLEAQKYFQDQRSMGNNKSSAILASLARFNNLLKGKWTKDDERKCSGCSRTHKYAKSQALCEACHWLLRVKTDLPPSITKGGKSKSVLFEACRLAFQLNQISDSTGSPDSTESAVKKWKLVSKIWGEALIYAACHCGGYEHARRLSKGGELLSHVWLLMAHFGISEQVRSSEGHAIAKLINK